MNKVMGLLNLLATIACFFAAVNAGANGRLGWVAIFLFTSLFNGVLAVKNLIEVRS